ncbi:MAG: hypothetical protein PHS66_04695, partial [Candidatus Omnitrophica bacterium]|nr:hypothetical protein [Candidatus Omnitrophota bacterium]
MWFNFIKNFRKIHLVLALVSILFLVSQAQAAQVKRSQIGSVYFDTDDISQVVDIQSVNQSKTMVLLYPSPAANTSNYVGNVLFTAVFESDSKLIISRDYANVASNVTYVVVEFASGVNVQRGISAFSPGAVTNPAYTQKTITLTSDMADDYQAFAIVQARANFARNDCDQIAQISADIPNKSTLHLQRDSTQYGTTVYARTVNVVWQVVEFTDGAVVTAGETVFAATDTTKTENINPGHADPDITNLDHAFLIFSYRSKVGVAGREAYDAVRGKILNASQVKFDRAAAVANSDIVIEWFVVEMTDQGTSVRSTNDIAIATGSAGPADPTLNPAVDPLRMFPLIGASGPTDTTLSTYDDEIRFAPNFASLSVKGVCYDASTTPKSVWVTNYAANTITKYNSATGAKIGSYNTGTGPIAVCSGGGYIWVANYSANTVTCLNASTGAFVRTYNVGQQPRDIAWDPSTNCAWTANYYTGATPYPVTSKLMSASPYTVTNYNGSQGRGTGICYDPTPSDATDYMWVITELDDNIYRFRCSDGNRSLNPDFGSTNQYYAMINYAPTVGVGGMTQDTLWAVSAITNSSTGNYVRRAYMNNARSSVTTNATTDLLPTDRMPRQMAWDTTRNKMFVVCEGSNVVDVIDPETGEVIDSLVTDAAPYGIAYDNDLDKVWVASAYLGTVLKYGYNATAGKWELEDTCRDTDVVSTFSISRLNTTTTGNVTLNWALTELSPISVISPNGGESWAVSDKHDIVWKYADSMSMLGTGTDGVHRVRIELSVDGGSSWLVLPLVTGLDVNNNSSVNNEGRWEWTVPASYGSSSNLVGNQLKVRVIDSDKDAGAPTRFYDTSDGNFSIRGKFTIVQPPNTWLIGETHDITWATNGNLNGLTPANATIKLSTDGTNFAHTLTATAVPGNDGSSGNSWSWAGIPSSLSGENLIGTQNKLKIILNYGDAGLVESATSNFTLKGNIYNVSPTSDETWLSGDTKTISWSKKGLLGGGASDGTVDIYYSSNAGFTYGELPIANDISAGTDASGGSWNWDIPLSVNGSNPTSKIKVVNSSDPTVYGVSADFHMMASLTVNEPIGGEIWRYNEVKPIKWTVHGTMNYVVIKYKVGAGSWNYCENARPENNLAAGTPEVMQVFNWTVPNDLGMNNVLIRVCNKDNENIYAESNSPISIKGTITVNEPHLNEILKVTDAVEQNTKVITWTNFGTFAGTADIRLSLDGGSTWPVLLTEGVVNIATPRTYEWTILPEHRSDTAKIKVALDGDEDMVTGTAGASAVFKVIPYLKINYPSATGISKFVGETLNITWTANPNTFGTVGLRWDGNSGADGYQGFIANGINASLGGYDWPIPDVAGIVGLKTRVKVYQTGKENEVFSVSENDFIVRGTITLTRPSTNSGDTGLSWSCGTQEQISWNVTGQLGTVNLFYSKDNGNDLFINIIDNSSTISAGTGNGSYVWTLPINSAPFKTGDNGKNTQIKIKVVSSSDSEIYSISAQPLTMVSRLITLVPNGGQVWRLGEQRNITWITQGEVPTVNVKYSIDGGSSGTIVTNTSNFEGYLWDPVNCPISDQLRIRVESNAFPNDINLTSENTFEVKGAVTITSPNNSNQNATALIVGSSHLITWTRLGAIGTLAFSFAPDGVTYGAAFATGVDSALPNYAWTVPDAVDLNVDNKIKVVAEGDSDVNDESEVFQIKGSLDVAPDPDGSPNNSAPYHVGGDPIDIQWKYTGTLGNISLYYDTNSGNDNYPNFIITRPYNNNEDGNHVCHYSWPVPNTTSNKYRVKIVQASDATYVHDASIADFSVHGTVTLVTPGKNPGSPETWTVDGISNNIDWSFTGTIANVDIYLDTLSGTGGYPIEIITGRNANAHPYTWTIPSGQYVLVTSDACRIRVSDSTEPTVYGTSTNDFKIKPVLTITKPDATSKFRIESSSDIEWLAPKGKVDKIKIEYSLDAGSTWETPPIADNLDPTALRYGWTIPDSANGDTVVRISKVGDSSVKSDSQQFSIMGSLQLVQPIANVNMPIFNHYLIKWIPTGTFGKCKIEYSTDSEHAEWKNVLGAEDVNAGASGVTTEFDWTIPNDPSPTTKVRIYEKANANDVIAVSSGENGIIGSIFMVHPMNAETMVVGKPFTVEWTFNGNIPGFVIDYFDGTLWHSIIDQGSALPAGTTTYAWTVPDTITSAAKVKVSDKTNAQVFGETTADNYIKGSILLTNPNGYNTLAVGESFNVTWDKTGTIGNLAIEYSTDPTFATDLHTAHPGWPSATVPFPWEVPDFIRNTVYLRLTSVGGLPVSDSSDNPFTIKGAFTAMSPNGGQIWYKDETSKIISWTASGTITNVDIKYKTSASGSYDGVIVTDDPGHTVGSNQYIWPLVPDINSEECYIKISDHNNLAVPIESAAAFSVRPVISVSKPLLGADFVVGTTYNNAIAWSLNGSTKVSNVDVLFSTNGISGPFDKTILTGVDATLGTCNWSSVPDNLSSTAVIKVVDKTGGTGNSNVFGLSPVFNIIGSLTIQQPNDTSNWAVGATDKNITWLYTGSISNINIYYDYGTGYGDPIATGVSRGTGGSGSWTWAPSIPDSVSNNVKVKISSVGNPSKEFNESVAFKIKGSFTFDDPGPVDGEVLPAGSTYPVKWSKTGTNIPQVKLEFSTDGITFTNIGGGTGLFDNTGTYSWSVPVTTNSKTCKLRISDPNNEEATRATSAVFEIRAAITVSSPATGDKWTIGTTGNNIAWGVTGIVDNVRIDYSKDNGTDLYAYNIVASRGSALSPYAWSIPTNQDVLSAAQAKIKVSDAGFGVVYGLSSSFMVKSGISISAPTTATIGHISDPFSIAWTTLGTAPMGNVNIYFSKTGNPPWGSVVATVAYNSSPYAGFSLPLDSITNNVKAAKVRIEQVNNTEVFAESDAFEIEGKIVMDEPIESGLKWAVGSTHQIKWTPQGTYSPVKVEYSTNGFTDELQTHLIQEVANSANNVQKVFDWEIPDAVGNNVKIRISHSDDPNVVAVCTNAIKILGAITDIVPNGGQIWYKGDSKEISWYEYGTISNVKIEYKTTLTGALNTVVADHGGHLPGANSYTWTSVADENSETCYIRVSDADPLRYPDVFGVSAAPFSIRPKISVSVPVLDQSLAVGSSSNTISWSLNGSTKVQYVKLYYSKDGGEFTNVIDDSGTVDATVPYTWNNIPDAISGDVKVRVVDNGNPNVYGTSESFNIIGSFTIQQPDVNQNWLVGSTDKNITWLYKGSMGTADILYKYGAGSYTSIASGVSIGTGGAGSWNWPSIPDSVSGSVQVKIASSSNPTVEFGESAVFKIRGGFTNLRVEDQGNNPVNVLQSGSAYNVRWSTTGSGIANVRIQFSSNNGETWADLNPVEPYLISNTGSYSWTAPTSGLPDPASSCLVKVFDPNNAVATLTSSLFEVRANMVITDPISTDEWVVGTTGETIAWTTTGVVQNVSVDYSRNNGSDWINIKSGIANTNSTTWN